MTVYFTDNNKDVLDISKDIESPGQVEMPNNVFEDDSEIPSSSVKESETLPSEETDLKDENFSNDLETTEMNKSRSKNNAEAMDTVKLHENELVTSYSGESNHEIEIFSPTDDKNESENIVPIDINKDTNTKQEIVDKPETPIENPNGIEQKILKILEDNNDSEVQTGVDDSKGSTDDERTFKESYENMDDTIIKNVHETEANIHEVTKDSFIENNTEDVTTPKVEEVTTKLGTENVPNYGKENEKITPVASVGIISSISTSSQFEDSATNNAENIFENTKGDVDLITKFGAVNSVPTKISTKIEEVATNSCSGTVVSEDFTIPINVDKITKNTTGIVEGVFEDTTLKGFTNE